MNKSDLVDKVAELTRLPKNEVEAVLNKAIGAIQDAVKDNEDVTLSGFGTFTKSKRKARQGYNPHTGEEMKIPAMTIPKFRPGKDFKKAVDGTS